MTKKNKSTELAPLAIDNSINISEIDKAKTLAEILYSDIASNHRQALRGIDKEIKKLYEEKKEICSDMKEELSSAANKLAKEDPTLVALIKSYNKIFHTKVMDSHHVNIRTECHSPKNKNKVNLKAYIQGDILNGELMVKVPKSTAFNDLHERSIEVDKEIEALENQKEEVKDPLHNREEVESMILKKILSGSLSQDQAETLNRAAKAVYGSFYESFSDATKERLNTAAVPALK